MRCSNMRNKKIVWQAEVESLIIVKEEKFICNLWVVMEDTLMISA